MMTSVHRTKHLGATRRAFTLIEIIVTLAIIAVLLSGAILLVADNGNAEVADISQKTRILAKETLREAKFKDRPQSIFIAHNAIWTEPESTKTSDSDASSQLSEKIEIPEHVSVSVLAADSTTWSSLSKNAPPFIWAFTQTGLCEPISLRFESEDALYEASFHTLTAGELVDEL